MKALGARNHSESVCNDRSPSEDLRFDEVTLTGVLAGLSVGELIALPGFCERRHAPTRAKGFGGFPGRGATSWEPARHSGSERHSGSWCSWSHDSAGRTTASLSETIIFRSRIGRWAASETGGNAAITNGRG